MSTLYTGRVRIEGGRSGSFRSSDERLSGTLDFPSEMGGAGSGTNPEQLFAAAYGACFAATIKTIAEAEKTTIGEVRVAAAVSVGVENNVYDLIVRLSVEADQTDDVTLRGLIEKAKRACPYSRATRGNVETVVELS